MRQLLRIPHPTLVITVFGMNEKYIVKLEAGPMEQSYKLPMDTIGGLEKLHTFLDQPFLQECIAHFNAMYGSFKAAQGRFDTQGQVG
jgi:hypothetical protein